MIYLNNAASTFPKPDCVNKALLNNFTNLNASSRSLSFQNPLQDCRKTIGDFLQINPDNIIFTSGCTMALNMAILGFPFQKHEHIVITSIEHHALLRPMLKMMKKYDLVIHLISCKDGIFDMDNYLDIMNTYDVKMVAMTHSSNVLGNIIPISEISQIAHEKSATVLVDCAQAGGYLDIDFTHIDMAAFAGHKGFYGPTGVGFLYIRDSIKLTPITTGGTGGDSGKYEIVTIKTPSSFEVGTQPVFLIKTLCEGIKWVEKISVAEINKKELELYRYLLTAMQDMKHIKIYGEHSDNHLAIISFNVQDIKCKEIEKILFDKYQIIVRSGFHCSSPTHDTLYTIPLGGTVRVSIGYFNTKEEIDTLIKALNDFRELKS